MAVTLSANFSALDGRVAAHCKRAANFAAALRALSKVRFESVSGT